MITSARVLDAISILMDGVPVAPQVKSSILEALQTNTPYLQLVTESAAADLLGVSRAYLGNWRKDHTNQAEEPFPFTTYQISAGILRYDAAEIRLWLTTRAINPQHT